MDELGFSQEYVAKSVGMSLGTFRNTVLAFSAGEPDSTVIGGISLLLGWPFHYLGGLMDGSVDLQADPFEVEQVPVVWKKTATERRFGEPKVRGGPLKQAVAELRAQNTALTERVAELERKISYLIVDKSSTEVAS
jgi:hypothetical protein